MIHAAAPYLYWNQELILIALDAVALHYRIRHKLKFQFIENKVLIVQLCLVGTHEVKCYAGPSLEGCFR